MMSPDIHDIDRQDKILNQEKWASIKKNVCLDN